MSEMTRAQELDAMVCSIHTLSSESPQDQVALQVAGQTLLGFVLVHHAFLMDAIKIKEAIDNPTSAFIEEFGIKLLSKEARSVRQELCNSITALLETVRDEQG